MGNKRLIKIVSTTTIQDRSRKVPNKTNKKYLGTLTKIKVSNKLINFNQD